jgi:hypothetical protein
MAGAIAIFVSWRFFGWRDQWELHPSELRRKSSILGFPVRTRTIPLSALAPAWRRFIHRSPYVLPPIVFLVLPGVLEWVYSSFIAGQPGVNPIPTRALRGMLIGAAWALAAACSRVRHVSIAGTEPIFIRYVRWERRAVDAFAERLMMQIREASAPDSQKYGERCRPGGDGAQQWPEDPDPLR